MRKRIKWVRVAVFGLIAVLSGCDSIQELLEADPFYWIPAPTGLTNRSQATVQLMVSNKYEGPFIGPGGSKSFNIEIPVTLRDGEGSVYNKTVTLEVGVFNQKTGLPSRTVSCVFGGKVVTSVFYEVTGVPPYEYERVECRYSW